MADAEDDTKAPTAPPPPNLSPKPHHPPSSPSSCEDDAAQPPRKRPRTQAPSRPKPPPEAKPPPLYPPAPSPPSMTPSEIHRFPIQPLTRFAGASASIKRPREVTHFSYDDTHTYRGDASSISYYHPPQLPADLRAGFDSFNHYEDTSDPHLDSLLRALADHEQKPGSERVKADFVTWRGMMTKIMTAPFDMFAEFNMFATKVDGTVYIEEDFPSRQADRDAQRERAPPRSHDPRQQTPAMMTYWGYKFETLALLPTPPGSATTPEALRARTTTPVSNHAQHCSIVSTSFGPHSLLLGGEVDGLSAPKPPPDSPDPIPWVELKTSEQLPPRRAHRDLLRFERKLLKFWAQSFLLGVPRIIVGWRTREGILTSVQEFETAKIPGMVRRSTGCWDGNVCVNFAAGFLGWLRETVEEGGVFRVSLQKKGSAVEVERVADGSGRIVSEEFLKWREKKGDEGTKKDEEGKAEEKKEEEVKTEEKDGEKETKVEEKSEDKGGKESDA